MAACGCIKTARRGADDNASPTPGVAQLTETQKKETKPFGDFALSAKAREIFQNAKETHAWAMFSSSGWSNDGQILVLGNASGLSTFHAAAPDAKEFTVTQDLTSSEKHKDKATKLWKIIQDSSVLKDHESTHFDGIQYYYFSVEKGPQGALRVTKFVKMNNPSLDPGSSKPHVALVEAFKSLLR